MGPRVRPPAVAGRFYPADPAELEAAVRLHLDDARSPTRAPPRALVAPHAGYVYSGPVAGSAWALVGPARGRVRRAVLLGPSHHVAFAGLALPEWDALSTPLGEHPVDAEGAAALEAHPLVRRWDAPHRDEHCLEVQLPFLWATLGPVPVVPLVMGTADAHAVADEIESLWTPDTLVVVSSDLSHHLSYARARDADARTARAVEELRAADVGPAQACGATALRGLLTAARRRDMTATCVDLRNSGDTAGGIGRVVGYGAFGVWPPGA